MQLHKNKYHRTIIVGDIHGCFDEFQQLLKKVDWDETEDRLILVGDIVNKGYKSTEMLEWVFTHPNVVCLLGNHEYALLEFLERPFKNDCFETIRKNFSLELKHLLRWIKGLPLFYEDEDLIVVHAGIQPGKALEKQDRRTITTIRTWDGVGADLKNPENPAWFDFYYGPKTIVFGHWASLGLYKRENLVGLDSGCVYGNQLSAYIHPLGEIVQVQARKTYRRIS